MHSNNLNMATHQMLPGIHNAFFSSPLVAETYRLSEKAQTVGQILEQSECGRL
jgi:hypothetical protein